MEKPLKNHLFFGYAGNKRCEMPQIYEYMKDKLENIETIIEPFCGSAAFSYYLSIKFPKKYKYVLNDIDENLINLYKICKDENKLLKFNKQVNEAVKTINKEKYNIIVKKGDFLGWFISNLIHAIRSGMFNLSYKPKEYNFENIPIVKFLRTENVIIKNVDALEIYNEYKTDIKSLIFLDPPYLISCNSFYSNVNINIYEYLYNNSIDNEKAFIILVLESNWIINLLFKNNIKSNYNKLYQPSKKHTNHLIISNKV
jgi:site-specific DNA-adenine methylase